MKRLFLGLLRLVSAGLCVLMAQVAWTAFTEDEAGVAVVAAVLAYVFLELAFRRRGKSRRFTYDQELFAAEEQRVVHITYRDKYGNKTQRDVEVYRPREDNYLFGYCRLKKEPRTFLISGILKWEILPERYLFNPLIEEWFATEGKKMSDEREDWQDWVEHKRRYGGGKPYILKKRAGR